jgi:hypothetical protein
MAAARDEMESAEIDAPGIDFGRAAMGDGDRDRTTMDRVGLGETTDDDH